MCTATLKDRVDLDRVKWRLTQMMMVCRCREGYRPEIITRIVTISTPLETILKVAHKYNRMFLRVQKTTRLHTIEARVGQQQPRAEVVPVSNFLKLQNHRLEVQE
jgi:hypothetical protein